MDATKAKILIVDDEKGLRIGAKRLLEGEGYEVDTAENGTEGIEKGVSSEYDLAIIDIKMPDVDGIEVLKRIKNAHPSTVCFMATAYASYDTAIESTKLGAYSYIPKPFSPDELLSHVHKGVERRKLIIEAEKLRKEREERLLEVAYEKTRLNTIINSIADGVLVVNKSGEAALYNPSALKLLHIDDLVLEQYCLDKIHPEIVKLIKKILNENKFVPKSYSTQIEVKSGGNLFIEATCSPVPHPDGSLAGVAAVISNITELKKVELIKSQFVSMVAHELKTPIAAVMGFIKIILDDSLGIPREQVNDFLTRSYGRLKGLLEMVNDLLDISRMELKTKQRELAPLNVEEIIKSTVDFLELDLKKKGLVVNFEAEPNLPSLVADQNQINRLFTNMLSNAIKYNKDNGRIDIKIWKDKHYLIAKISDTGIGIAGQDKDKLFQEFFRIKNERTRGISGTGLGLSIVKKIVETYAGKIEVESKLGEGTAFTIYLPYNGK